MTADGPSPSVTESVLLGLLQGPCELLPISSSAHIALVPWLLGSGRGARDAELEKSLEVALHAGTAAALLVVMRSDVGEALHELTPRRLTLIACSFLPPAIVGFVLERPIERRLGTPATIAAGLLAGSVALVLADRTPGTRGHLEAGACDGLWLGVAQACALVPGVSRNGATLAAARWRGFGRRDAERLSRHVALPVIIGASALKGARLLRRRPRARACASLLAGGAAAAASTLAAARVLGGPERDRPAWPFALYRVLLAAATVSRLRSDPRQRAQ